MILKWASSAPTFCLEVDMTYEEYFSKVVEYARHLCIEDGKNPDSYYEEFDRDAAWNDLPDDDVFRKVYSYEHYMQEAHRAVEYFVGKYP